MSISLKKAIAASMLTVVASSTGLSAFAQATTEPSTSQPQTADTAVRKAEASKARPRMDSLPVSRNALREQPDQAPPARPLDVHPDENRRTGPVPPTQRHVWHVRERRHRRADMPRMSAAPPR